ncbi:MAG: fibronectin type III domain-containing protein [Candidatus Zixiibacteriota bacterium]|nr:MAG: fibronectin type III domain-containing protein [candidate division Zixibacteria bacterium]
MKKHLLLIAIMMVFLAAGCERTIDSENPVRSIPEPAPTPTSIQVLVNEQTITLDWTVSDSSNVLRYRIYVADTLPVNFRLYDSSTISTVTLTNLLINQLYYFRVVSVDRAGLEGVAAAPVSATIGYSSIAISGGAQYTTSRDVIVMVNSSAPASQVILSEDPDFADANFIPWAPERTFTLSPGDGLKIVYGRLVFSDGSVSGELLEDGITLDTRSEIDSVFIRPAATIFAPGQTVTFGLDAGGELFGQASVSFSGVTGLDLYDNGTEGDNIANDGIYYGQWEVPVNSNLFNSVVTGSFTDAAGNPALPAPANELLNTNTVPEAVTLARTVNNLGQAVFTWTRSLEPDFLSYYLYSDPTPSVGLTSQQEAVINDPLVTEWVAPTTTRYYRVFVFDQHGASAGSNVVP